MKDLGDRESFVQMWSMAKCALPASLRRTAWPVNIVQRHVIDLLQILHEYTISSISGDMCTSIVPTWICPAFKCCDVSTQE